MLQFRKSDNTLVKSDDLVIRNLNFSKKFCIDLHKIPTPFRNLLF